MLARTTSYTLIGLDAVAVEIEVDAAAGLPGLVIVGLPDQAVKEARERVRAALLNSQFHLPNRRLTVNLAPADMKKEGAQFDLAIALGILAASHQLDPTVLGRIAAIGELALDGSVRPVAGALPIALAARAQRRSACLVPSANARETAMVEGLCVIPVASLTEAVEHLSGRVPIPPLASGGAPSACGTPASEPAAGPSVDFADVRGQALAKRAMEIAAAGGHHVLLVGSPGSGKSMLAQRLPTIQPDLTLEEALEVTKIHSVVGLLPPHQSLVFERPFRAPHHTASTIALIGGGSVPRPGEVSLAHRGVLFLDELPEFHRDALESLRQPLEDGSVNVVRARRASAFPAQFMLVAAMNPCPCGYAMDPRDRCRCPTTKVAAYLAKVSGPLLDRIDLHVAVAAVPVEALASDRGDGEPSAVIKARVVATRERQRARLAPRGLSANAQMRHRDLRQLCPLSVEGRRLLASAMTELQLSARSYDKILKIARTIADLADSDALRPDHLAEAIQYRALDRQLWV